MRALVELRGVSKSYSAATVPALENVSLTIGSRAQVSLIGRSGSGKSTLLHLIAGLERPSAGEIAWPALGDRESLLPSQIGLMFQSRSLIPWLDVAENVALPLQVEGRERFVADEVRSILDLLDLRHLAQKLPDELSGGQAQRVSLARAMVTSPSLLLADEPTGQLDHVTGRAVIAAILDWADDSNASLLIATHDPEVAAQMDIVWSIHQGKVTEVPN